MSFTISVNGHKHLPDAEESRKFEQAVKDKTAAFVASLIAGA
jgi:hypothetical protein